MAGVPRPSLNRASATVALDISSRNFVTRLCHVFRALKVKQIHNNL